MARIRLVHWNGPEGRERKLRLASLGHHAEFDDLESTPLLRAIRANPPDAIVIDLSRLPSHGREIALSLRSSKATRQVPLIFVDGEDEKVARLKALLPDAIYTSWGRLRTAIPKAMAMATNAAAPVVPRDTVYAGKPTIEKLGVKEGMRVALLGAPEGFAATLKPLPKKVTLSARPEPAPDVVLCFVRSARELAAHLATVGRTIDRQTLWMVWPKKSSGVTTDLSDNVVRETGLAAGLVDFKVCSVDATWSGLAFKRRK